MTSKQIAQLANRITKKLFTAGNKRVAHRLILVQEPPGARWT